MSKYWESEGGKSRLYNLPTAISKVLKSGILSLIVGNRSVDKMITFNPSCKCEAVFNYLVIVLVVFFQDYLNQCVRFWSELYKIRHKK